jgi:putative hydrolase of the HAD superfamily
MDIRAIAFDVNGTLVEILTEDHKDQVFRAVGHYLTYQGIDLRRGELRDRYFALMREQRRTSPEAYPEFDAVLIWQQIIAEDQTEFTRALPPAKLEQLPLFLAEMSRGVARRRLRPFPHVRAVLDVLAPHYPLAVVTDAQSAYARAELHKVGLLDYFDPIVVSGDHGYRKPDRRLFELASAGLGVPAEQTLFIGNDMHRDIYGAREAGMATAMFDSDQGVKQHLDCVPDFVIRDWRELPPRLGLTAC